MTASLLCDRETRKNLRQRSLFRCGLSRLLAVSLISAVLLGPSTGQAGDARTYTFDTYSNWVQTYRDAKPDFKPGDVLTSRDIERMRPFVPPGFLEDLDFPEFQAPIIAPRKNIPRQDFVNCTEKYQSQVKLLANGALANYVCGQPIADSSINTSDPTSGIKAAWNFNFRWQHYGITKCAPVITWARFPGTPPTVGCCASSPAPTEIPYRRAFGQSRIMPGTPPWSTRQSSHSGRESRKFPE